MDLPDQCRNLPEVGRTVIGGDRQLRPPPPDRLRRAPQGVDLSPLDVHLDIGHAIPMRNLVQTDDRNLAAATVDKGGAASPGVVEPQDVPGAVEPHIERLHALIGGKVGDEPLKGRAVGLEGQDAREPAVDTVHEEPDRVAVVRSRVHIDLIVRIGEEASRSV